MFKSDIYLNQHKKKDTLTVEIGNSNKLPDFFKITFMSFHSNMRIVAV